MKKLIVLSSVIMLLLLVSFASTAHAGYYTTRYCGHCGSRMTVYVQESSSGTAWGYSHTCGHTYTYSFYRGSCSHCSKSSCLFGRSVTYQTLWSGNTKTGAMQSVSEHSSLCGWNSNWTIIW